MFLEENVVRTNIVRTNVRTICIITVNNGGNDVTQNIVRTNVVVIICATTFDNWECDVKKIICRPNVVWTNVFLPKAAAPWKCHDISENLESNN